MLCSKCGVEILNENNSCSKCGNSMDPTNFYTSSGIDRKRHGFTTFWLIFSLISPIVVGIVLFFGQIMFSEEYLSGVFMLNVIISATLQFVASILLLSWRKLGFWLYTGSYIFSLIMDIAMSSFSFQQMVMGLVFIFAMRGVLQIRKNGKTTWQQLE